jgi:uncharacterized RmlC-like cupin family protein
VKKVVVVSPGEGYRGKQALEYFVGVSAESVGSERLCAHLVAIPPGGRAAAHLHEHHESAIYVLEGAVVTWFGPGLEEHAVSRAGDFVYVPAGVPHLPVNMSETDRALALVARTDPNEQESVVLLPDLDGLGHTSSSPAGHDPT